MISSRIVIYFLSFIYISASAQTEKDSLNIKLTILFYNQPLVLDKEYVSEKDTLQIETVKFYLSNIEFMYADGTSFAEKNSYHLVDASNKNSMQLNFHKPKNKSLSKVRLAIGVDSLASTSGALSGDLDATKGMYWAWQSGFINMKIEGSSKSCKTRKNKFQFHIGGYLEPYYAMRTIEIPIKESQYPNTELNLSMDLGKLFEVISLKDTNTIMIPGKEAMKIADLTTKLFSIK